MNPEAADGIGLSQPGRFFWLAVDLLLGLLPCFLFLLWVQCNAALPAFIQPVTWPWISFPEAPTGVLVLWDLFLLIVFGPIFTRGAGRIAKLCSLPLQSPRIPFQAIQPLEWALRGTSLWMTMALWQHTGVVIWALPTSPMIQILLTSILFWSFMALSLRKAFRLDALGFLGVRQIYQIRRKDRKKDHEEPLNPEPIGLIQGGMFSRIRRPGTAFALLAFLISPLMTLDRMILAFGAGILLSRLE